MFDLDGSMLEGGADDDDDDNDDGAPGLLPRGFDTHSLGDRASQVTAPLMERDSEQLERYRPNALAIKHQKEREKRSGYVGPPMEAARASRLSTYLRPRMEDHRRAEAQRELEEKFFKQVGGSRRLEERARAREAEELGTSSGLTEGGSDGVMPIELRRMAERASRARPSIYPPARVACSTVSQTRH